MSSTETSSSEDEDDILPKPKHMLKPPKFDGQSSFGTFMAQFSNCARHNKWKRAEKLAYLRNSLDKEAANILWDYGKDITDSLSGLMNILESSLEARLWPISTESNSETEDAVRMSHYRACTVIFRDWPHWHFWVCNLRCEK